MTTSPTSEGSEPPLAVTEARAVAMHDDPRFRELRARLVRFVLPASVVFLAWYLLYVLLSAYADGLMSTKVVGNANVALFFGLLQFVTTFGIAILYSRYANRSLDPLADELRAELEGSGEEPAARRGEDA
ncbi:DUF485 domain-containing protein [Streptomyces hoynatensis]|uniref:DUF485 domain-containing protein n=1 Tax=Streptomyces hoynatensis TaxID=1141874 RepID=A0A3A9ZEH7_9ACTN|nr:DUF485 domain-containing protein [Streptomyces hoynatensis]RKN46753.1 DUF485 domain-containing protein [Streptomyces hoynatensis]